MLCIIAAIVMYNVIIYLFFSFSFPLVFPFPLLPFWAFLAWLYTLIRRKYCNIWPNLAVFVQKVYFLIYFFLIPLAYIKIIMYFYSVNKN